MLILLWPMNLGRVCLGGSFWSLLCSGNQMSTECAVIWNSPRLDILDGSVGWLTVDAGCWLAGISEHLTSPLAWRTYHLAAGFLQSESLKRIRLLAFSNLSLEVMQHHFHYILLAKMQASPDSGAGHNSQWKQCQRIRMPVFQLPYRECDLNILIWSVYLSALWPVRKSVWWYT